MQKLLLNQLEKVNNFLIQKSLQFKNQSLLNGKMGICLYFYYLSRYHNKAEYIEFAEKLLKDILNNYQNVEYIGFENGLSGIGWGLEYLIQNGFIDLQVNDILEHIDNKIYARITDKKNISIGVLRGLIGHGYYITARIKRNENSNNTKNNFINERLIIEIINKISEKIDENQTQFCEPQYFEVFWDLPQILIFFSNVYNLNIYNYKIHRIIEYLSHILLSFTPVLNGNKLFLLLGIESILQHIELPNWRKHADMLKQNIKLEEIFYKEIKNKNLDIKFGISGILLILKELNQIYNHKHLHVNINRLINRYNTSEFWNYTDQKSWDKAWLYGLLEGYAGIGTGLLMLQDINNQ